METPAVTPICAWCQKREGILTILDGTPQEQALLDLEDDDITHGICERHSVAFLKEAGL